MDEALLIRFLTHRCTPLEIRQIEQWVVADKANAEWLFEMERIWGLKDEWKYSDQQKIEKAYKHFLSGLEKKESEKKKKSYSLHTFLRYTAVAIVVVLLSLNLYYQLNKDTGAVSVNTIGVPKGQRVSLTLSDGTKVCLNSQSILTYPSSFSKKSRDVTLIGEGFFEVAHNEKVPFAVHSSLIKINVLGTKFNVKAYPDEAFFVTLADGVVEVVTNDESERVVLKPSQQVSYTKKSGLILAENVDPNLIKSWTVGELCFVNRPLSQIAITLERRFNVQISIQDEILAADIFTCRFKENVTIEQVLTYLKETQRMDYRIDGQRIEIIKYKK